MNIYIWEPVVVSDMQWPCPDWFHVPTKDEWDTLSNLMTWLSQSTAFVEKLHIPLAWYRSYSTGAVTEQWTTARFWTSIRNNNSNSNEADITTSWYSTQNRWTWFAYTIRPFKNTSVTPTSSWTIIYQWSWSAGIFWNQTDWIISISSNWSTWYTIADKNLWATTVWNNWDTLSESNCWKFYQRWNNYWFPFSWSVTTSYTQVNASTYWPWNYYSSSTFILDGDWETSVNKNLRWGVSQWTSLKSVELKNAYIGENKGLVFDFQNNWLSWCTLSDTTYASIVAWEWISFSWTTSYNYGTEIQLPSSAYWKAIKQVILNCYYPTSWYWAWKWFWCIKNGSYGFRYSREEYEQNNIWFSDGQTTAQNIWLMTWEITITMNFWSWVISWTVNNTSFSVSNSAANTIRDSFIDWTFRLLMTSWRSSAISYLRKATIITE